MSPFLFSDKKMAQTIHSIEHITTPLEIKDAMLTCFKFMIQKAKENGHPKTNEYIKCFDALQADKELYIGIACEQPMIRFTITFPDVLNESKV